MIIYCPSCNTETLLAKADECESGWKCNNCNVCCLQKNGIPFQNEEKDLCKHENEPNFIPMSEKKHKKYHNEIVKKVTKRKQTTIFDFLKK